MGYTSLECRIWVSQKSVMHWKAFNVVRWRYYSVELEYDGYIAKTLLGTRSERISRCRSNGRTV